MLRSGPMTDRKLLAKVSCGIVTQRSHDGRETAGKGFPTGMSRIGPLPDRKLLAKGFPLACHALVLCRTGNCLRRVSHWHVTHWSFAGQETACKRFPTGMLRSSPMTDGKLPAKGFLLACHALVLCRTGNCLQKVSYWHVTQQPHDGQETFTHKKRTPMKGVLLEWQKIILQS